METYIYKEAIVTAKQWEGGAENATPIIDEFLKQGLTATWTEAHDAWESEDGSVGYAARPESIAFWNEQERRVSLIHAGDYLVYSEVGCSVVQMERFHQEFLPYNTHSEDTLSKAFKAINEYVHDDAASSAIINNVLNAGLLFRERG